MTLKVELSRLYEERPWKTQYHMGIRRDMLPTRVATEMSENGQHSPSRSGTL